MMGWVIEGKDGRYFLPEKRWKEIKKVYLSILHPLEAERYAEGNPPYSEKMKKHILFASCLILATREEDGETKNGTAEAIEIFLRADISRALAEKAFESEEDD